VRSLQGDLIADQADADAPGIGASGVIRRPRSLASDAKSTIGRNLAMCADMVTWLAARLLCGNCALCGL
jgi:hypothetical protein